MFVVPEKTKAAGNAYNFSDMQLTESVETCAGPTGPCNGSNFVRVGQDQDFYVQVAITLSGLTNTNHQPVNALTFGSDEIFNPGFTTTNFNITGAGASFVSKVTQQQAQEISDKLKAGAKPEDVGGIPCYSQTLTSTGSAVVNGVFIIGVAGLAVWAAPVGAAAAATALTSSGSAAAGTAALSGFLWTAGASGATGAISGAAAGTAASFLVPVGPNNYIKCDSPVHPAPYIPGSTPGSATVNVGDVLYKKIVVVPHDQFQKALGLSQLANATQDASTQPVNEFYVVPDVYISSWLGLRNDFMSAIGAGKSVYVQLYDTEAHAYSHVNDAVPTSVPGNGSNTGSGQNVNGANGSKLLGFINDIIAFILGFIQEFIYGVFYWLIAPLIQAMLSIRTYTDTFVAVIYPGWLVVRNLTNIIFIVALIAIGAGTLLRIESYQYKHLLVQLILAALLVNFSLVIGQAVLGVADTVQSQFLPNNVNVIRELAKDLMVGYRSVLLNNNLVANGQFSVTVQQLFLLSLSMGSFMVFLAIAGFLVVRICMLWVLLLISPLAYAAGVLPATAHYRGEWWSNFVKYAFFTPIMAFFLNMTAVMATAQRDNPVLKQITGQDFGGSIQGGIASFVFSVASNLLLLVFLIIALQVAEKFGIYGADIANKYAKGAMFFPFKGVGFLAKRGGGLAARIYNEQTSKLVKDEHGTTGQLKKAAFAVLNPVNFFKGWGERAHEKSEWAQRLAQGAGQVVASELLTLGKEKINYKDLAIQKIKRDIAGKLRESLGDDPGRAESMDLQRRVNEVKGFEGELLRGAAAQLTGNQGWGDDTNEVASDTKHDREYWLNELKKRGTNEDGIRLFQRACNTYDDQGFETMQWVYQGLDLNMLAKLRGDKEGKMYNRDSHGHFEDPDMNTFLSSEKNQRGLMNVAALTDGAKKVGHYEQMFMAKKDDKTGLYIPLVDSDWAREKFKENPEKFDIGQAPRSSEIIGEVNKIGIRRFWQDTAWHTMLRKVKKDKDGRRVSWDEDGEWGVGGMDDGFTLLQDYLLTRTMAGKKYASQASHAQARIIQNVIGKCFNKEGVIVNKDEYGKTYEKNKDLTEIMTFMQLTGNPPRENDFLYDVLTKHGNRPEDFGIRPPSADERSAARGGAPRRQEEL